MTQKEWISSLLNENQDATIIGSLGTISYDVADISHPDKILIKGAMGMAMGCGLGYALVRPERKVIVLIGDGSFLMKMGSMATILKYCPKNLEVYILNNNQHKSTGGQETNFKELKKFIPPQFKVIDLDEIHDNKRPSITESYFGTSAANSKPNTEIYY